MVTGSNGWEVEANVVVGAANVVVEAANVGVAAANAVVGVEVNAGAVVNYNNKDLEEVVVENTPGVEVNSVVVVAAIECSKLVVVGMGVVEMVEVGANKQVGEEMVVAEMVEVETGVEEKVMVEAEKEVVGKVGVGMVAEETVTAVVVMVGVEMAVGEANKPVVEVNKPAEEVEEARKPAEVAKVEEVVVEQE